MTWYCWKGGAHIVCRSIHGLLIRGIPESMIFEVEAETWMDAKQKANEIIMNIIKKYQNGQNTFIESSLQLQKKENGLPKKQ